MRRDAREVWLQLTAVDFRLIEELQYLQHDRGYCFPSRAYLAKKLRVNISTISRHTHKLKRLGLLLIQPRRYRRRDGTWKTSSNVYKLLTTIGAKVRSIFARLTGVLQHARIPKKEEKSERFDLSFCRDEKKRKELERFGRLGNPL